MPELPEVETIVRKLSSRIIGLQVAAVVVNWERSIARPSAREFTEQLVGRTVSAVSRRGKYIVITLAPEKYLLVHLRMTGRLIFVPSAEQPHPLATDKHTHVICKFTTHGTIYFRDTRKFGRLSLVDDPAQVTSALGVEPLDTAFTPTLLGAILGKRHRLLKPALLDQTLIAGLGNIYTDEALWLARIHPLRASDSLTPDEVQALHSAIIEVLTCALGNHGTTLRDYRDPDDQAGANGSCLQVYGREGQSCNRCGKPIERIIIAQRSSHICAHCQVLRR